MPINAERLLKRFLRYVQIDTTANDETQAYPSSSGQLELGRVLVKELQEIGLVDTVQDEHGLVWATIPATCEGDIPIIAFNAHLDTSPETPGCGIKPQVVRDYAGGDLTLPGDSTQVIRVADNPELESLIGATLVTTDGTTLLGADDKSGVAILVELAAYLTKHPEIPHGPLKILFTCDEEIGRGVQHVDLEKLNATACYTLDGEGAGSIDVETFSADAAVVKLRGINIHPAVAKDRMVNAVRAAADFVARLPREQLSPETTGDRLGFIHPYKIDGGVGEVTLKLILRDFDTPKLDEYAGMLQEIAKDVELAFPGLSVEVTTSRQYRNLGDGLANEPRAASYAEKAHQRLGVSCRRSIIRGGTDGSLLTELGLPTPNLSSGQHNPHSPLEWACLDQMTQAAEVLVQLVQLWAGADS